MRIIMKYLGETQLKGITHNIVATNNNIDATITPIIGSNKNHDNFFAQMSLYDFMLFDEISTDDKIKELNTYIGITPKVTLPNYYWDNYGKKNTDAKRGYIDEQVSLQKTGTSVNPLENFNISYEGMSGYNGYPVVFGANKTWETSNAVDYIYDINSTIVHITNVKHAANGLLYSYVKRDGALANIKEIPAFRVTVKGLEENSKLVYKYLATENATKESIVYLGNGNPIIKGENEDNLGLVLGKYWKGIIYKTILYSKTISLLEINFLKNLMEKDEIIDINHPIFISNTENESNTSQDT
jgi:hypothetical protein